MKKRMPVILAMSALVLAGCSSTAAVKTTAASSPSPSTATTAPAGTVRVLYAGSLVNLMKDVQPAFDKASDGNFQGESGGSDALVSEIKGKVKQADVFVSASTGANAGLEGATNGAWESWYAEFATAPLVIAYNPKSKFATDLKTMPWPKVVQMAGFTMGSTDPASDPKGQLAVEAMKAAGVPTSTVKLFPEEQLLARLASGNLDAGFFYSSEAADAHLPTISLGSIHLAAAYTISVLNKAPNAAGGRAFVNYLFSAPGKALLLKHGLTLTPIKVAGTASSVPTDLRPVLGLG